MALIRGLSPDAAVWAVIREAEKKPVLVLPRDPARNQAFVHKYGKAVVH